MSRKHREIEDLKKELDKSMRELEEELELPLWRRIARWFKRFVW